MPKTQLIIRKVLEGRIAHNDGDFAEIETIGTEGIEKNLWLDTIHTHREDSLGGSFVESWFLINQFTPVRFVATTEPGRGVAQAPPRGRRRDLDLGDRESTTDFDVKLPPFRCGGQGVVAAATAFPRAFLTFPSDYV